MEAQKKPARRIANLDANHDVLTFRFKRDGRVLLNRLHAEPSRQELHDRMVRMGATHVADEAIDPPVVLPMDEWLRRG